MDISFTGAGDKGAVACEKKVWEFTDRFRKSPY